MSYHIRFSDYPGTATGPPDPERWIGPPGPVGPAGPQGQQGVPGTGVNFNVQSYGATGNGTTYDTAAIQAAANAIPASGGTLYLPAGTYLTNGTVRIKSNTQVMGDGPGTVLLGGAAWSSVGAFFINQNYNVTTLTDTNIVIRDLTMDYGPVGTGGSHCVDLVFVRTVKILNVIMQCRGAGNAVALMGCADTLTDGCSAFDFINCAYDHWVKPQRARVVNCFASSAAAVGFINFNPENTTVGTSSGNVASGFVLANNHFVCTGGTASAMQLEPLETGTSVRDVIVTDNIFENLTLALRGAVSNVIVKGNQFINCLGGNAVVFGFANLGGTPSDFVVSGNIIVNPTTVGGNVAVIRLGGNGIVVEGNRITGASGYSSYGIDTSAASRVLVQGNLTADGFYNGPLGTNVLSVLLRAASTSTTPVVATADGLAPGAGNVFNVAAYFTFKLRFDVIARIGNGATTCWFADNVLMTVAGSPGSVTVSAATFTQGPSAGGSTAGLAVAVTADTTNGGLRVACTGIAGNVDWAVLVTGLQVQ